MLIGYMVIKVSFKVGLHGLKKGSHSAGLHRRKNSLREIWSLEVVQGFLAIFIETNGYD